IDRKVGDANAVGAAVGFAPDGHTVAAIKVVVRDGHVGTVAAGLDGYVVVAGADEAVGDGDIGGGGRIDSVCITRVSGRVDDYAPRCEPGAIGEDHVKIAGVFQRDAVEGEVLGVRHYDEARAILRATGARLLGEVPPRHVLAG